MAEELNQTTSSTKSTGKNGKWKGMTKVAEDVQDQVVDTAKQAYGSVVETASNAIEGINTRPMSFIREYPMQAAIAGVVIGFILGSAVSRRSIS